MSDLVSLQSALLEILVEFDRICRKNHIKYILDGGTLLGAVRHNGFIPWDDDADVAMTRKNYNKFVKSCRKDLDKNKYVFEDIGKPKEYSYNFGKLKMLNTYFCEIGSESVKENHGIYIDIFPMDNTFGKNFLFQSKGSSFFETVRWCKIGRPYRTKHEKSVHFFSKFPLFIINNLSKFFMKMNNFVYTKNVCKICHYGPHKLPHSRTFYLDLIEKKFCDKNFFIPRKYEEWLTMRYGNWRKLPPQDQQRPAHETIFKIL